MLSDADYSPDGKRIVTMSDDKTARIWDANTGRVGNLKVTVNCFQAQIIVQMKK